MADQKFAKSLKQIVADFNKDIAVLSRSVFKGIEEVADVKALRKDEKAFENHVKKTYEEKHKSLADADKKRKENYAEELKKLEDQKANAQRDALPGLEKKVKLLDAAEARAVKQTAEEMEKWKKQEQADLAKVSSEADKNLADLAETAKDDLEDLAGATFATLFSKARQAAQRVDSQAEILKKLDSKSDKDAQGNADARKKQLKEFEKACETAEKHLQNLGLKVRSEVAGDKSLPGEAQKLGQELFGDLKKLEIELKKVEAGILGKKVEVKEVEVIPSEFVKDYTALVKDLGAKPDKKILDALKRVDVNNAFDKVTRVCEAAQRELDAALKAILKSDSPKPSVVKKYTALISAIEKYDKHMFLLSRLR